MRCSLLRTPSRLFACLAACTALVASTAHAQNQQSREREALRRVQQQVQRLQQENGALQSEKAQLEAKLKSGEAELGKAKGEAGKLKRSASSLRKVQKDNQDLMAKLAAAEVALAESRQKHQTEVAALRTSLAEAESGWQKSRQEASANANALQSALDRESDRARVCEDTNVQLYGITMDLIDRYKQNRGVWEKFLLSEPFTQLKSVQVENLLADMRERAEALRVQGAAEREVPE